MVDRVAEREIRRLEAEVSKWQIVVEQVTGQPTADFDNQTVDEDLTLESRSTAMARIGLARHLAEVLLLKPLDIDFMKQMSNKVNSVPVIAKSDCLTMAEIKKLKARIIEELAGAGIRIYQLPDVDQDEDEEYKLQVAQLRQSIPFAVCGANAMVEVAGKKVRGRQYPWGVVEVENPEHCDFVKLRSMLITHMQDLQEVTHDVHYENFRSEQLARGARGDSVSSAGSGAGPSSGGKPSSDAGKDKMLAEKDEELRRMQEMLAKMQEQIKQQSSTNLSAYNN